MLFGVFSRRHLLSKNIGESMLNIRKKQYRMHVAIILRRHLLSESVAERMLNTRKKTI